MRLDILRLEKHLKVAVEEFGFQLAVACYVLRGREA